MIPEHQNKIPIEVWMELQAHPHITDKISGFLTVIEDKTKNPSMLTAWNCQGEPQGVMRLAAVAYDMAIVWYMNANNTTREEAATVLNGICMDQRIASRNLRGKG